MEEDEIIGSETKRRNILLTKKIYKPESWNFNTNLSVESSSSKLYQGYNEYGFFSKGFNSETSDPLKIFSSKSVFSINLDR